MAGKALSEDAGKEIAALVRSNFGTALAINGLEIQLKNGQATPVILGSVSIPTVTESAAGAMSASDKSKLNGVEAGANKTIVDSALSSSSDNPVQNKAINAALGEKAPLASPAFTGTPTAPTAASGTNNAVVATTAFVTSAISNALASAMTYKGAASAYSAITETPYKAGWCWIVSTAGTFAGQDCEVGDMVVANKAKGSSAADSDFDVIQSNMEYVTVDDVRSWFA